MGRKKAGALSGHIRDPPAGGASILKLVSSILHYSWDVLTFLAARTGSLRCFVTAFSMGFIDSLVPFSNVMGLCLLNL